MDLSKLRAGENVPDEINVIIEIPAHSEPIKYEFDKASGALFVDRFLSTSMHYPCNYGYVPNTLSEDGDPVDVLVITPIQVNRGCVVHARPIGVLAMTDEAGDDKKILAVPTSQLTGFYDAVHELNDLPASLLNQIEHFFAHYKDLEVGKWVKIQGWLDKAAAKKEIMECIARYKA